MSKNEFEGPSSEPVLEPGSSELHRFLTYSEPLFTNDANLILGLARSFANQLATANRLRRRSTQRAELVRILEGATQVQYLTRNSAFKAEGLDPDIQNILLQAFPVTVRVNGVGQVRKSNNPLFSDSVLYRKYIGSSPYIGGPFCVTSIDNAPGLRG